MKLGQVEVSLFEFDAFGICCLFYRSLWKLQVENTVKVYHYSDNYFGHTYTLRIVTHFLNTICLECLIL